MRILAIDWSGRRLNPGAAIWLAEVANGKVVRLEGGRDRDEIAEHFRAEASSDLGRDAAHALEGRIWHPGAALHSDP